MSCDDAQRSLPQRTARLFIKRNESCLFPECRLDGQSSSRHGLFKRDRSRHRPPTRLGRRVSRIYLLGFGRKGPETCTRSRIRGGKALAMKADSASAEELRAAVTKTA